MTESNPQTYVTVTTLFRTVMQRAAEEARRLNHGFVGTEHILLALVALRTCAASIALANLRLEQRLRREVMKIAQPGPNTVGKGALPQTPSAKRAIEYAIEEARVLEQISVGTGHLLLGLLRDPDGMPAKVFANLGVNVNDLRAEIARHSDDEAPATQIAEGLPPHHANMDADPLPDDWVHLRNLEPSAMQVFFAWEKLRIVYNLILATLVLAAIGPQIVIIIEETVVAAILANLGFCAGPFVENYLCWIGMPRRRVRSAVFLGGMLVAICTTIVAINEAPVQRWNWL